MQGEPEKAGVILRRAEGVNWVQSSEQMNLSYFHLCRSVILLKRENQFYFVFNALAKHETLYETKYHWEQTKNNLIS